MQTRRDNCKIDTTAHNHCVYFKATFSLAFDGRDIAGGERKRHRGRKSRARGKGVLTLLIPSPTDFTAYSKKLHFQNVIFFNFVKLFQNNKKLMDWKSMAIEAKRSIEVIIVAEKYFTYVILV